MIDRLLSGLSLILGAQPATRGGVAIESRYPVGAAVAASSQSASMNSGDPGLPPPSEDPSGFPKTRPTLPGQNTFTVPGFEEQDRFALNRYVARVNATAHTAVATRCRQVRNSQFKVLMRDPKAIRDEGAIRIVEDFFARPDKHNWLDLKGWLSAGERDVQEIGALCFFPHRNLDGSPYSLNLVDPATIQRQTTKRAGVPGERPAYVQILNGSSWATFSRESLWMESPNPTTDRLYPLANTDAAVSELRPAVLRGVSEESFARDHGHKVVFLKSADGLKAEEQEKARRSIENDLNQQLDPTQGYVKVITVPAGGETSGLPEVSYSIEKDELVERKIRAAYGLSPTPYVRDNNRGTAQEQADDEDNGLVDRLSWWSDVLTKIVHELFGFRHIEVQLSREIERDELAHEQASEIRLRCGKTDVDEERKRDGLEDAPHLQQAFLGKLSAPKPAPFGGSPFALPVLDGEARKAADAATEFQRVMAEVAMVNLREAKKVAEEKLGRPL